MNLQEKLKNSPLIFDGGMGVYYNNIYNDGTTCEEANILYPERIIKIHKEYIEAGANAIKTNTYAAKDAVNIEAALKNAKEAVGNKDILIFASIGSISDEEDEAIYFDAVDTFISLGVKYFDFETFTDFTVQEALAKRIHDAFGNDAFVICSFGILPDGYSANGFSASTLVAAASKSDYIDCVGLNCVSGPSHMAKIISKIPNRPKLFSAMPNAGYPTIERGIAVYGGKPKYFAEQLVEIYKMGVPILGGCCGTNPTFIKEACNALKNAGPLVYAEAKKTDITHNEIESELDRKFKAGERVIALEIDPPSDDNIDFFMDGAKRLVNAGADSITIADCPVARARADSSMLAAKLKRELGVEPIPHMTCRDRNINAIRALLLGLSIENVHNVLLVTGDPVPTAERKNIKSVFSFNSSVLASYILELSNAGLIKPFKMFGALNVNSNNFSNELDRAMKKEEAGISAFLTQPVMTDKAYENLALAHEKLNSPILGGIYPIVSHKNAVFMSSEVSGVSVPKSLIDRYFGLSKEDAENLAVELAVETAERMKDITNGLYLMTPFKRITLMENILNNL
ncbi:MAG: bifunctional homocysteine S-methyltransferase/methylenetetrahydrofolate reductase [Oscillospiraceae bacterium]|nr:bifunctional homocysteine S-methyltransferase/methylenetetrahydrofolate reductase [Oscillospiraceae bacterium]